MAGRSVIEDISKDDLNIQGKKNLVDLVPVYSSVKDPINIARYNP